jgi:hypothetical protein
VYPVGPSLHEMRLSFRDAGVTLGPKVPKSLGAEGLWRAGDVSSVAGSQAGLATVIDDAVGDERV